jgi:kumamolisin
MIQHSLLRRTCRMAALALGGAFTALLAATPQAQVAPPSRQLSGHIPRLVGRSTVVGRAASDEAIQLALALPLRNPAQLNDLLTRLYDPNDPDYGHYLTTAQFTANFGPTQADYKAVIAFAQAHGLTVTNTHPNRLLVDVTGNAKTVESAFGVKLMHYKAPNGRVFRAPAAEPIVQADLANRLTGIIGLDTAAVFHTHCITRPANPAANPYAPDPFETRLVRLPRLIGTGPGGGLAPSDIKTAYNLNTLSLNGTGQTMAVFELAGYSASDIAGYESYFGLPAVPLQNVLVDGYSGARGQGADEVTLDIEMQIAMAPGASELIVYEGPGTDAGVIDTYNRIATDNLAREISTCWGDAEDTLAASDFTSESAIFEQMAAQGQAIFAAGGDNGAYDDGSTLSVDDPGSEPFMVSVGGTSLATQYAGGPWQSETTWNSGSITAGAGGGGISAVWPIPSYQASAISPASLGSTTMRNVPDVSLDADPNAGYAVYYRGSWTVVGGTSCTAPLWAGFTALVNQQRSAYGSPPLGFANPALYQIAEGPNYHADYHDIADGSNNLYYPAVAGYDDATGWGSMVGANLLHDLSYTPYNVAITADFNHDGKGDILFQDPTNGNIYYWLISVSASPLLPAIIAQGSQQTINDPNYKVVGAPDLTGSGFPGVLFQYQPTGDVYYWILNNLNITSQGFLQNIGDPNFKVVGTPDLTGNGKSDIIFEYQTTGNMYYWMMNGATITSQGFFGTNTDPNFKVVGTPDLTGNGISDIIFENQTTGNLYYWMMNGATVTSQGFFGNNQDPSWWVVGTPDLNGDGHPDILFQNKTTGVLYYWLMNGTTITSQGALAQSPYLKVVGTPDLNGDGKSDILFENPIDGQLYYWLMNGATVTQQGSLP